MPTLTTAEANAMLPEVPTKGIIDPDRLKYLVITPPKWGKTTTLTSIPDSILLAFEEGHAFAETHKIVVDQWDRPFALKQGGPGVDEDGNYHMSMMEARDAIVASDRFRHVIIDTADMAARMCVDYHCALLKVKHPSEAGDFGKGYDLTLTAPFRQMLGPIIKSGRGISFTTHAKWVEKKKGDRVISASWETSLPSQAQAFLHSQVDVIWQGEFAKRRPGQDDRDRVLVMDGSSDRMAGCRVRFENKPWPLPKKFILAPVGGWDQWRSFFPERAEDEWIRSPEEALANCRTAEVEYEQLVLGQKAIEREEAVAAAAAVGTEKEVKGSTTEKSPVETASTDEQAEQETPAHLQTPPQVKPLRRTKAA